MEIRRQSMSSSVAFFVHIPTLAAATFRLVGDLMGILVAHISPVVHSCPPPRAQGAPVGAAATGDPPLTSVGATPSDHPTEIDGILEVKTIHNLGIPRYYGTWKPRIFLIADPVGDRLPERVSTHTLEFLNWTANHIANHCRIFLFSPRRLL